MGFVRVELPFEGKLCNDCMFEESGGIVLDDYCALFDEDKLEYMRCVGCMDSEFREKCPGECTCA